MTEENSLAKAILIGLVGSIPILVELYAQEPKFRWWVDEFVNQQLFRVRYMKWTQLLRQLPGWRRELVNHMHELPAEFHVSAPTKPLHEDS